MRTGWLPRSFDIGVSSVGLLMVAPVLLAAAVAIWIEDGLPIFYRQPRVGRGGSRFVLFKLRSMFTGLGGLAITSSCDSRVTNVGRWLRKYKLDELPQLWNVLKGDMSIVGPRPEVPGYVDTDAPEWREVLSCRPGITDLATLVYRNEEDLLGSSEDPEKFYREQILPHKLELNLEFLRSRTCWLDLKLIFFTVRDSFWPSGFDAARVKRSLLYKDPI